MSEQAERKAVNEVAEFRDARWWAPPESFWKLAGFTTYKQIPSVERLSVHLKGQQNVFIEVNNLQSKQKRKELKDVATKSNKSQLVRWLELNRVETNFPPLYKNGLPATELLYTEITKHYRWCKSTLNWIRSIAKKDPLFI